MKTINLIYNSKGFLEEQYEDGSFYIAKEEDKALSFNATFPASLIGSVRAYLQFRGGGDVVECGNININSHTVECAVDAKYLSYNFLKIGFEVVTANKEIRFEPVTIEVDEFVNVGGKSSAEGYTVTVKVGNVTKLDPGEEPYVTNSGTAKDVVLDFGIPKGDKPEKGVDYYTDEEKEAFRSEILEIAENLTFDFYYEFNNMVEAYEDYITPGLYKFVHKQGGNVKVVILLVRKFSSAGFFQMKFVPTNIETRKSYANEDGTIGWNEWVRFATESSVDTKLESKADKTFGFDYYYETDVLDWDDDNYKRVGIHKICVNSNTQWVAIILTRQWITGLLQLRIYGGNISARQIDSAGNASNWEEFAKKAFAKDMADQALESAKIFDDQVLADSKAYTDEKASDLSSNLSNALKGNASGEIIRIDDVSPLENILDVRLSGVEDVSTVKLKRHGKNIINIPNIDNQLNSKTIVNIPCYIPGTITISGISDNLVIQDDTGTDRIVWRIQATFKSGKTESLLDNTGGFKQTFKGTSENPIVKISYRSIYIREGQYKDIQVELGSEATEHEPYIEPTEYAVNADGTVDGVTSLSPTTCLLTDTEGAFVDCTYNRDINKAFAELYNAIISLGGNV